MKERGKFSVQNIEGPLTELANAGRILGIIYETDDGIHVEFWRKPTPAILRHLREAYKKLKGFVTSEARSVNWDN